MLWLTALGRLAKGLEKWQAKALDAKTEQERIYAEAQVARIKARMEAQTSGEWTKLPKIIRGLWAAPYIIFTWKVVVIDKVLKAGVTDPLSDHDKEIMLMILGFYFLFEVSNAAGNFLTKTFGRKD